MNFPKFLKFPEGKRIVQIFSSTTFEEVVVMGTSYFIHTNNAVTHADRIYVMDLLEGQNGAEFITNEEYIEIKARISSKKHVAVFIPDHQRTLWIDARKFLLGSIGHSGIRFPIGVPVIQAGAIVDPIDPATG